MATSPQVADAVPAISSSAASALGGARLPIISVLIFMLLGAAIASLGFGGVLYYLVRSGRLFVQRHTVVKAVTPTVTETHLVVLDPLLVNLADEGESSYLRLSLTLQVADAATKKDSKAKGDKNGDDAVAAIRDTALTVLGRQTANSLLAPDGKKRLKAELKKALAEHNSDLKVTALFFTDFLVQQ
jgi:flagellar protein FliL